MSSIIHTAIHHDPEGRCNDLLRQHAAQLSQLFHGVGFAVVTRETMENHITAELLAKATLHPIVRSTAKARQLDTAMNISFIGAVCRGEGDTIFSGCLDRTLHWINRYSDEFTTLLENGTNGFDYLILGRTERAFMTHPLQQREPEQYTNNVTARQLGMEGIDVATGCRMMTRNAVEKILQFLTEMKKRFNPDIDIEDSVLPIIAKHVELTVGFLPTEGLEFETPDQYSKEIQALGYNSWIEQNFTLENTRRRWHRAEQTAKMIQNFPESWLHNKPKERI